MNYNNLILLLKRVKSRIQNVSAGEIQDRQELVEEIDLMIHHAALARETGKVEKIDVAPHTKYVWFHPFESFSDTWTEALTQHELMQPMLGEDHIKLASEKGYKLIRYECLNDDDFNFNHCMKLR